ncbi:MAG: hypothetical protein EOP61_08760 [Sphingomonadales bacterium]|nr:MAG: hypothetical protein EOP61_08760 [Sphingomonadales bacterium]
MKNPPIRPRAALLIGAAFLATPAFAQDAPAQSVTPPPILVTPAPAPAAPAQRVIQIQPQAPIVQAVPETPAAAPAAPARTTTTTTTTRQTRSVAQTRAATPARQAAPAPAPAPVAAPVAAPANETPAAPVATTPETTAPAPLVETQPVAETTATTTQSDRGGLAWPWLLGGIALVIAGIAAALLMRRRQPEFVEDTSYRETVAVAPAVPAEQPAFVADTAPTARIVEPEAGFAGLPPAIPLAEPEVREAQAAVATADDVSVSEPAKEDLAGVVDGTAPVSRRPWIELGMRPVRAGTNKEEAVVDFELTVGNSGDTSAKDVRISTFMLADGATDSEIESLMIEHRDDTAVSPVTIEPGEGTRVDAHLAVPKGDLGRTFNPVVVAEARYTLPDGRQGRTSAAFRIGTASENGVGPLAASRPFVTETVEAELYGTPEHA